MPPMKASSSISCLAGLGLRGNVSAILQWITKIFLNLFLSYGVLAYVLFLFIKLQYMHRDDNAVTVYMNKHINVLVWLSKGTWRRKSQRPNSKDGLRLRSYQFQSEDLKLCNVYSVILLFLYNDKWQDAMWSSVCLRVLQAFFLFQPLRLHICDQYEQMTCHQFVIKKFSGYATPYWNLFFFLRLTLLKTSARLNWPICAWPVVPRQALHAFFLASSLAPVKRSSEMFKYSSQNLGKDSFSLGNLSTREQLQFPCSFWISPSVPKTPKPFGKGDFSILTVKYINYSIRKHFNIYQ